MLLLLRGAVLVSPAYHKLHTMNQKSIFFLIFALVFLVLVVFLFSFFSEDENRLANQPLPQSQEITVIAPEFLAGTFSIYEPNPESIEISIQGANNDKTVQLSWDDSVTRVFYIVVFDGELYKKAEPALVAVISGVKEVTATEEEILREDVLGFISPGYVIGDAVQGFSSNVQGGLELEVGKEYYLQVIAFAKDDKDIIINKTFTFTESCFPPNCQ